MMKDYGISEAYKKITSKKPQEKTTAVIKRLFQKPKGVKQIKAVTKRREKISRGLLNVAGVLPSGASKGAVGRPRGTYKYGMPIQRYKQELSRRRAEYSEYKSQQMMRMAQRGISPQQYQELQTRRTIQEQTPQFQQSVQQSVSTFKGDQPEMMADEELAFERWNQRENLSPSARAILSRLRRVQNKGKLDNIRQQRIHEERRIISQKASLFKAHENMTKVSMDMTGVSEDNILKAPNVFRELPENRIIKSNRPNILQTKETGNNIQL